MHFELGGSGTPVAISTFDIKGGYETYLYREYVRLSSRVLLSVASGLHVAGISWLLSSRRMQEANMQNQCVS